MNAQILKLEDIGRGDVAVAGGKGANLGELLQNDFRVPPGFVVTAQVCQHFFESLGLDKKIEDLREKAPDDINAHCAEIRNIITETELPSKLADTIIAAHAELVANRQTAIVCAVRSSATAEDLGDASFAGQHETYYYVTRDRLLSMIRHCWASLWSPEAMSYRSSQGIDHASVFMAVVVQEMIPAEVSGVTFSANPVTGSRNEIVIESSWGMGAAIVDGRVTPDHYVVERHGLKLREKRIAEKKFLVPARLEGPSPNRLQEVPHALRQKETLSEDLVRRIADQAVKAETHFESPQDVEWAIADGQLYMLQSRPITVMGREEIGKDVKGKYVLFKPLIENFTEPLTPLAADLWRKALPPGIKLIQGWIYVNFKVFRPIFPYKISDEEAANLLYSLDTHTSQMKLSLAKLPIFLIFLFASSLIFAVTYARTRKLPDDFMDGFRDLCQKVERDPAYGPIEIFFRLLTWTRFFDPIGNMVMMVNWSAGRYFFLMDALKKLIRRWLPNLQEDTADMLTTGGQGVLSVEMGRGIWSLADTAKKNPQVRQLIEQHKPDKVLERLQAEPDAQDFVQQLTDFLAIHGHRGLKELEFRSPRWEEDPTPILGMVRNYLIVESDPLGHEKKVQLARDRLETQVIEHLAKLPFEGRFKPRRRVLQHLVQRIKYFAKMRENSRFYHIMGFYMVRKKILRIEAEFMQQGKLRCKDDIFYLLWDEVNGLHTDRLGWTDVEDQVHRRRMEHIRHSKIFPPKLIGFKVQSESQAAEQADGDTLTGQAASSGIYEGVAHVILNPSADIELKPGEILVAPYTDPAWTPLFLTAGAAVVEVGSYLSHAGTVAREFGMPCVVDVSDCTKRIHSGARVKVNGDEGLIRIISEQEGGKA